MGRPVKTDSNEVNTSIDKKTIVAIESFTNSGKHYLRATKENFKSYEVTNDVYNKLKQIKNRENFWLDLDEWQKTNLTMKEYEELNKK